jgi:hypothetical protein
MRFDWKRLLLALCLCGPGCADFKRGPASRDAGTDWAGDTTLVADLTFEAEVYPILEMRCAGCHQPGQMAAYTKMVLTGNARLDRAMVLALVVPGDPAGSLLIQRATGETHTGGKLLTPDTDEYNTVAQWIMLLDTSTNP